VAVGSLDGRQSQALGVNNRGQVIGVSTAGDSMHGFVWQDGVLIDLGLLGGSRLGSAALRPWTSTQMALSWAAAASRTSTASTQSSGVRPAPDVDVFLHQRRPICSLLLNFLSEQE
jgi:probable HAF family extracellular repeat protein